MRPERVIHLTLILTIGPALAVILLLVTGYVYAGVDARPAAQANVLDRYEVNDFYTQTQIIVDASPVISLTFCRSGGCSPNDVDWYAFNVNPNTILNLTASSTQLLLSARAFRTDGATQVGVSNDIVGASTVVVTNTSANIEQYFVRITNNSGINAVYSLGYVLSAVPPATPTNTPIPGLSPDAYEPNDNIGEASIATGTRSTASFIAVGASIPNLSFTPFTGRESSGDIADWFLIYGRAGSIYQINTANVQPGVETVLAVFNPDGVNLTPAVLGSTNPNNRFIAGQRGSQVIVQIPVDGSYWVRVTNLDQSPRVPGQTYSLSAVEILQATLTPSLTPTPGPSATPFPGGADRFEYNGWFDTATLIAPGVDYRELNFVPWSPPNPTTQDNDFYRLPVKQGVYYSCFTFELSPGTDTNMIIYNQDQVGIGGNDDVDPESKSRGDFSSRFTWLSGYTGFAYVLVGDVNPPRANEGLARGYSLRCNIGLPATPTPTVDPRGTATPTPPFVPPTPEPPEPTMTPYPTPRTAQNLPVRPIEATPVVPLVPATPEPRRIVLSVQIHNDFNRNSAPDPGEGIAGVSVRVSDEASGLPLGQGLSDADGRVNLVVFNPGPVRLAVPLFGYSAVLTDAAVTVRIGVVSSPELPKRLP